MQNELVSIIVPVYNVEPYLNECLLSIANQTYANFEAVLVDDGSTDKSGKIADDFAQKDKRFKVIHTANGGPCLARNTGMDFVFRERQSTAGGGTFSLLLTAMTLLTEIISQQCMTR